MCQQRINQFWGVGGDVRVSLDERYWRSRLNAVQESIAIEVERVQLVGLRKLISRGSQVSCGLTVGFQNQKAREIAVHAAGGASNDRTGAAASIYEVQGLSCWDVYGPATH